MAAAIVVSSVVSSVDIVAHSPASSGCSNIVHNIAEVTNENRMSSLTTGDPNVNPITRWAIPFPGQDLLPNPNGISKFMLFSFSNLSGLKLSGSSHNSGSLCIAHILTNTIVSRGMSYP
ncbi:hypothetical protein G4B88_000438 [Cannabis sativa]|uniref:Uncharacterized protein n=1 Tax=Cannabis sativa TaxID=3483 RepID=A0A7J6EMF6_CANSA|nr:hypothetical protein G4B88_000438 [Cannabis sativa]